MSEFTEIIQQIHQQVETLISENGDLRLRTLHQERQHRALMMEIAEKESRLALIEEENRNLKTVGSMMAKPSENQQDVKLRINDLVSEIDRCIALLNR